MKAKRQAEILRLVGRMDIETQEQMLDCLRTCGIRATQATISRDIKELNLVKQPTGEGRYKYAAAAAKPAHPNFAGRLRNIFKEGVTSFDMAQNIVVVKTMPGLAPAAGAALDGMEIDGLVGSLAGDDTVILIMRNNQLAAELCKEMGSMLD
ncbi:MAG TPA: arginine repressor [Candidatus Enterenecus merdae]|nr:arginine repressor [Candidatus Enterenecus merdae]